MDLINAISKRHSIRVYKDRPLDIETVSLLSNMVVDVNAESGLNIQLVINEKKAFSGPLAYGKFKNVSNYLVIVGKKEKDLDFRVGYYGEKLVLQMQNMGISSCWAGLSYRKIPSTYHIENGEEIVCYIAIGYAASKGRNHKIKKAQEISNISSNSPEWFLKGINAVLLAPTAINQQKFYFQLLPSTNNQKPQVKASTKFSLIGYTRIDLGIACLHFELGAGKHNFQWI